MRVTGSIVRTRAAALVGAAVLTGVLAASSSADAATAAAPFAGQVKSPRLTSSQASTLQREVAGYLRQTGGTQVSANRVDFTGGYLLVAAPGQRYARDLSGSAVSPNSFSNCGYGDFCAYSGASGSGSLKAYYICQDVVPFTSGNGSVYNHQSSGAQTKLYKYRSGGGVFLALTLNAGSTAAWTWTNTADVRTC